MTTAAIDGPVQTDGKTDAHWDPGAADAAAVAREERARALVLEELQKSTNAAASAVLAHVASATSSDAAAAALVGLLADGHLRLTGSHRLHLLDPAD